MCAFYNFCEIFLSSCRFLTERRFQFCRQLSGILYPRNSFFLSSPHPFSRLAPKPYKYNVLIPFLLFSSSSLSLSSSQCRSHLRSFYGAAKALLPLSFSSRPFHTSSLSFAKFPYHFIKQNCKPRSVPLVIGKSSANNRSCLDLPLYCT